MARGEILTLVLAEGVIITGGTAVAPGSGIITIDDATTWDGVVTSHTYDLSSYDIDDGTKAQWSFNKLVSAGKYEHVLAEIQAEAAQVTVKGNIPANTYRLIGMY